MDWKDELRLKILKATDQKAISKELKEFCKDILNGNTRFILVFLSGRGKYVTIRFTEKITVDTKLIILKKYGIKTYKNFKI